jgi:hypothetical protein
VSAHRDIEREPELPLTVSPKRWASQEEAIRAFERMTLDELREIAKEYTGAGQ